MARFRSFVGPEGRNEAGNAWRLRPLRYAGEKREEISPFFSLFFVF